MTVDRTQLQKFLLAHTRPEMSEELERCIEGLNGYALWAEQGTYPFRKKFTPERYLVDLNRVLRHICEPQARGIAFTRQADTVPTGARTLYHIVEAGEPDAEGVYHFQGKFYLDLHGRLGDDLQGDLMDCLSESLWMPFRESTKLPDPVYTSLYCSMIYATGYLLTGAKRFWQCSNFVSLMRCCLHGVPLYSAAGSPDQWTFYRYSDPQG